MMKHLISWDLIQIYIVSQYTKKNEGSLWDMHSTALMTSNILQHKNIDVPDGVVYAEDRIQYIWKNKYNASAISLIIDINGMHNAHITDHSKKTVISETLRLDEIIYFKEVIEDFILNDGRRSDYD